jgi:hypothetical protein
MALSYFTLLHIAISLIGIAAGFGVLVGLLHALRLPGWTAVFLTTTIATSVTGFFFPFNGMTPAIILGIISLIALALACYALYGQRLAGKWRATYVIAAVTSLYFNVFVLVVQMFQKFPDLFELAPTQKELPFAVTQGAVFAVFLWFGVLAVKRFRVV